MPDSIAAMTEQLTSWVDDAFTAMGRVEAEIRAAQRRHPRQQGVLWHSFKLLLPTSERMRTEFVYRAHCRELLERVAAGQDTRPGTDAELAVALCEMSLQAPLAGPVVALYLRVWRRAFPSHPVSADAGWDSQAVAGLERSLRRETAVADRRLGEISCAGRHNGVRVDCPYAWNRKEIVA